jgi:hypothetical protein
MHTRSAADLAPLYPQWDTFQVQRKACDPQGIFTTPYLASILGETV